MRSFADVDYAGNGDSVEWTVIASTKSSTSRKDLRERVNAVIETVAKVRGVTIGACPLKGTPTTIPVVPTRNPCATTTCPQAQHCTAPDDRPRCVADIAPHAAKLVYRAAGIGACCTLRGTTPPCLDLKVTCAGKKTGDACTSDGETCLPSCDAGTETLVCKAAK